MGTYGSRSNGFPTEVRVSHQMLTRTSVVCGLSTHHGDEGRLDRRSGEGRELLGMNLLVPQ